MKQTYFFKVLPLGKDHSDIIVSNWNYTDNIGTEKVSKSLEFALDNGLCYGTFLEDKLVSWVVTTKYVLLRARCT